MLSTVKNQPKLISELSSVKLGGTYHGQYQASASATELPVTQSSAQPTSDVVLLGAVTVDDRIGTYDNIDYDDNMVTLVQMDEEGNVVNPTVVKPGDVAMDGSSNPALWSNPLERQMTTNTRRAVDVRGDDSTYAAEENFSASVAVEQGAENRATYFRDKIEDKDADDWVGAGGGGTLEATLGSTSIRNYMGTGLPGAPSNNGTRDVALWYLQDQHNNGVSVGSLKRGQADADNPLAQLKRTTPSKYNGLLPGADQTNQGFYDEQGLDREDHFMVRTTMSQSKPRQTPGQLSRQIYFPGELDNDSAYMSLQPDVEQPVLTASSANQPGLGNKTVTLASNASGFVTPLATDVNAMGGIPGDSYGVQGVTAPLTEYKYLKWQDDKGRPRATVKRQLGVNGGNAYYAQTQTAGKGTRLSNPKRPHVGPSMADGHDADPTIRQLTDSRRNAAKKRVKFSEFPKTNNLAITDGYNRRPTLKAPIMPYEDGGLSETIGNDGKRNVSGTMLERRGILAKNGKKPFAQRDGSAANQTAANDGSPAFAMIWTNNQQIAGNYSNVTDALKLANISQNPSREGVSPTPSLSTGLLANRRYSPSSSNITNKSYDGMNGVLMTQGRLSKDADTWAQRDKFPQAKPKLLHEPDSAGHATQVFLSDSNKSRSKHVTESIALNTFPPPRRPNMSTTSGPGGLMPRVYRMDEVL